VIRVALIDSGVAPGQAPRVVAARAFRSGDAPEVPTEDGIEAVTSGALAHGPALADVLLAEPRVALIVARVFDARLATTAAQLAAALDFAAEQRAALASVSAGLREDREVLRSAIARARARGVLIVAAAPARGAPVFPAAYAGVVRATGDARCAPGEHSWLATAQADFGAHVRAGDVQGASAGCARVAAKLAALLAGGATPERALADLRATARYVGPERRRK
jgi:hypothetical protein